MRRMLTLGLAPKQVTVAVVPVTTHGPHERRAALLVLEKRQVCGQLSVQGFARCYGLTLAETSVLQALCDGLDPLEIAQHNGVAVCTIRSQIGSLRAKTGAASIRELLTQSPRYRRWGRREGRGRCTIPQGAGFDRAVPTACYLASVGRYSYLGSIKSAGDAVGQVGARCWRSRKQR